MLEEASLVRSMPARESQALSRLRTYRNLSGMSLRRIRRSLARASHMILAARLDDARALIDAIELAFDDLPEADVAPYRVSVDLLRGASFAFQGNAFDALSAALSASGGTASGADRQLAYTLYRFASWQLGQADAFLSPIRPKFPSDLRKGSSITAAFDLAIEAAMELDRLHLATAKRLALDVLDLAKPSGRRANGPGALAACVASQVLYEEGNLDDADALLRHWLPVVRMQSGGECALRAYPLLARIALCRSNPALALLLVQEAEALGARRGWPKLVAASLTERAWLLLQQRRTAEARLCAERLDAHARQTGSGGHGCTIARYRALTAARISLAQQPTSEAVAVLRLLYHQALDRMDQYDSCRLAVELAVQLAAIGEFALAAALFVQTLSVGAAAGLYQSFVGADGELGSLLKRAYELAGEPDSPQRALLPYIRSLLARCGARAIRPLPTTGPLSGVLSARERDVLKLICGGLSNKRIALALDISPETVKSHLKRIYAKLAVSTRIEALTRAGALGLL
ncbi:LuxR C-terminal-related transcriptional regulator [Paraburkholderia sp. 2C]